MLTVASRGIPNPGWPLVTALMLILKMSHFIAGVIQVEQQSNYLFNVIVLFYRHHHHHHQPRPFVVPDLH